MRRLLLILTILIILAATAGGLYYFRKDPTDSISQQAAPPPAQPTVPLDPLSIDGSTEVVLADPILPEPQLTRGLVPVTNEPVVGYWVNQLDGQLYYVTFDGIIRRAAIDSAPTVISSSRFTGGVGEVIASPRGDAVIIRSADPLTVEFKVYDVEKNIWRALPAGTGSAAWSPVSPVNEIAFATYGADGGVHIYTVAKGTKRTIVSFPNQDVLLQWPSSQTILLYGKPSTDISTSLWSLDIQKKNITTIFSERAGFWTYWHTQGATAFDLDRGSYLLSAQGTIEALLPFLTPPQKCVKEAFTLYCAVPQTALARKHLPDKYLQGMITTSDSFITLSLAYLPQLDAPVTLFSADEAVPAVDAWNITKHNEHLYFINRLDQKVYALRVQ